MIFDLLRYHLLGTKELANHSYCQAQSFQTRNPLKLLASLQDLHTDSVGFFVASLFCQNLICYFFCYGLVCLHIAERPPFKLLSYHYDDVQ